MDEKNKRVYTLNGKEYKLKEKYTLKDWGKILKLFAETEEKDVFKTTLNLIAGDNLEAALGLILDRKPEGELMEDDIEDVTRIITDFFSRKKGLMSISEKNSED